MQYPSSKTWGPTLLLITSPRTPMPNYTSSEGIHNNIFNRLVNVYFIIQKHLFSFDLILDCTGRWDDYDYSLLKSWANAKYLTLVPPLLNNFNHYGVLGGILKSIFDIIASNILLIFRLKTFRWVLFSPSSSALKKLRDYAQNDQVRLYLI